MKYFASLETEKGLNALSHNPCQLLDFGLLVLPAGEQYASQTGEREVLAVILGGKATFEADGKRFEKVGRRPNVFAASHIRSTCPLASSTRSRLKGQSRSP